MFTIGIIASRGVGVASIPYGTEVLADSPLGYWELDEVAVYNTKLSAARILAHYNAGV